MRGIVKRFLINAQPLAQSDPTGVIERFTAGMNTRARSLTNDQDPGTRVRLDYWARAKRQVSFADPTGSDLSEKRCE